MGIYLNPDNTNFRITLSADIYIDKTMMISVLNRFIDTGNKYICVSRARRFGKTTTSEMLAAYYSRGCDSRELFSSYKIASDPSFEKALNKYNVIQIDMNSEYQFALRGKDMISRLTAKIKAELKEAYPDVSTDDTGTLAETLLKIYQATGDTFILIMDEYDVLVREQADQKLFEEYLSFLNGLFKSAPMKPVVSLAYLTGILPIVRDRIQSKLNNFKEYTMYDAGVLAEYIGFTADEVVRLCEKHGIDYDECRRWYDGYYQNGYEIYNPKSVIEAVGSGRFSSYWSQTSTYKVISDMIGRNFDGTRDAVIRMMSGENIHIDTYGFLNTLTDFENMDDVFTYLIHLGYLTYNTDDETCRIPNNEVYGEWQRTVARSADYRETDTIIKASEKLLEDTIHGDASAVALALDESHIHVSSNRSYNNEDVLQSAIYLAYIYALNEYTIIREMTAGKGFADVVFIPYKPDRPAMIIELKKNSSADSAIDQIKEKRYYASLSKYRGDLLFVGINYDEKLKTHDCKIEHFNKTA